MKGPFSAGRLFRKSGLEIETYCIVALASFRPVVAAAVAEESKAAGSCIPQGHLSATVETVRRAVTSNPDDVRL